MKKEGFGVILLKDLFSEAKRQLEIERVELDRFVRETIEKRPLSYSSLKSFSISPKHYIEYLTKERTPPTAALIQGSVFDVLLLTPEDFEKRIYITPPYEHSGRTNLGKEEREKARIDAGDRLVITEEILETTKDMIRSFFRDDNMLYYFEKMKYKQVKMEWKDRGKHRTGLNNIGYYDGESDRDDKDYFIADVKTAISAEAEDFKRAAYKFDYHIQVGGYTLGAKKEYYKFPDFIHMVVENKPPYATNVFRSSSKYIQECQDEYENILSAFKYCLDNNEWHLGHGFKRFGHVAYEQMTLPGYWKRKFG